jgi:molecular chaperone GrpE (heat shock protein)
MTEHKDWQESATFQVTDKRHFLDLDKVDTTMAVEERPRYPTYVEELMARVADTERRFQERKEQIDQEIGRTRARLEADYERRLELEKHEIVLPLLEVLDNLERALDAAENSGSMEHLREGVEMTAGLFRARLLALGVERIPLAGQPFDPNLGQAVSMVDVTDEARDGIVVEELVRGYKMGDRLLRPAQVRVGRKDH